MVYKYLKILNTFTAEVENANNITIENNPTNARSLL